MENYQAIYSFFVVMPISTGKYSVLWVMGHLKLLIVNHKNHCFWWLIQLKK